MKHLKLFFALFAMLALGVGNAWGAEVTTTFVSGTSTSTGGQVLKCAAGGLSWVSSAKVNSFDFDYERGYQFSAVSSDVTTTIDGATISKVVVVASSNTAKNSMSVSVGSTSFTSNGKTEVTITKTNNTTYTWEGSASGEIKISFIAGTSGKSMYVKSITVTYETTSATPDPVDPTVTFSNGNYTVGGTLNLSTLWTSNSDGAVTYTVKTDGGTGATINGTSFTATAAGTCEIKASQAATSAYNAIDKTATITVTAPTPATITLSEAGVETSVSGKNVGDSYTLPTTSSQTCGDKTFVGWSTVEISTPGDKPITNFHEPGAPITLAATQTFYAVYATETTTGGGTPTETTKEYTFSNYSAGTQYADNEEHKLDDDVTIYTTDCHFTTQLRIYSSSTYNGYVVSNQLPGVIKSMSFNLGYKEDNLLVYGSTDGTTWTQVGSITTTTVDYKDYNLDFNGSNYTYFKLDVEGTQQIRVAKMSITYISAGGVSTTYSDYTTSCSATPDVIVKTLKSIAVSDMTIEYVEGAEFAFDGTCTATYSVTKNGESQTDETAEVTPTEVSSPDMTTAGEKEVTVTYTENEVTKTATYNIIVSAKPTYTITWNNAGSITETTVKQGEAFDELRTVLDCPNGKKFMGWTAANSVNSDGTGVTYIKSTDKPIANTTYYAVFAVVEGGDETPTTATVSIASCGWTDKTKYITLSIDEYITASVSDGTNTGTFYSNGNNWRLYQTESATLTISATAGYEIQTVKVTYTNTNDGILTLDGSNVASGTESEINAASVTFGVGNTGSATNGHVRISAIEVVYAPAAKTSDYSLDCTIHTEPTWTISKDAIDFADKYVGVSYAETFTISASNLTDDIALAIDGSNFTVSPTSISKDATFPQTVTVTYTPTAVSTHNATLNITSGSTLSKSIALTGSATEATIYTLTALADIKPTDKVIIVGTSGSNTYAMSNDKGTSDAPAAVAVTVADNKIATNETNILWNIAKNGDNLTIYPADQTAKWLYCTSTNNGTRVGTNADKTFILDATSGYLQHTGTSRYLGIYNNEDWRCYTSTTTNIAGQTFAFYVLPSTDPVINVTPASKDFGVLTVGETVTQEIEITALNITQALTAELTGEGFTKSEIVDNKITITFAPTAEQEYSATLTISAGTEASASVTLAGEGVAAAYSVTYDKNGAEGNAPTDDTKYVAGSNVTVAGQGDMTKAGYRFAGWKYGENIYKAGAKFTMPAEDVTFVAQWVEKQKFDAGYWVLVTDASELIDDDYVVIAAADYNVAMKSYEAGNNCKQVEITKEDNLLTWNENVGVFQLDKSGENYTFQDVNTEQYLYAAGGTSNNHLKAADEIPTDENAKKYTWTISIADNKATIKAQIEDNGENKARNTIMYNATEGINGQLFSCYASGQKDIALYKYVTELPTPTPDYTRPVTAGNYGTICLPFGSTNYTGMELYEFVGKEESSKAYIASVTTLEAGVPYIFRATASELAVYSDGTTAATPGDHNGLHGTFTDDTEVAVGYYILKNNAICEALTTCYVNANRAYIVWGDIPAEVPLQMPGRKYIGMDVTGENEVTGFENITNGENTTIKVIENGQLIIIRNGEKFNAQGQKL